MPSNRPARPKSNGNVSHTAPPADVSARAGPETESEPSRGDNQIQDAEPAVTLADIQRLISTNNNTVCGKLDFLTSEVTSIKGKLAQLESSVSMNSDKLIEIENKQIPELHAKLEKEIATLKDQLLSTEIYNRKSNLLFYGIHESQDEDIFVVLRNVFCSELGIPKKEANDITIVNAHRLPHPRHKVQDQEAGQGAQQLRPRPVIAKFLFVKQRDQILQAFQNGRRRGNQTTTPGQEGGRGITVRTDLPPALKARRGILAKTAFNLRREGKFTRIIINGTRVVLQWKEKNSNKWNVYQD